MLGSQHTTPLQIAKTPSTSVLGMTTVSDGEAQVLKRVEYPFIAIIPRSLLIEIGSTC